MTEIKKQKKTKPAAAAVKKASVKTAVKTQKTAGVGKNVKKASDAAEKGALKAVQKATSLSVATTPEITTAKPAISGREAARLALVQKAATSKWASLYSKANKIPVSPYNLKTEYEIETAIDHKTLGWGYIQDKKNDRLEVLFENGIKYLISNYK